MASVGQRVPAWKRLGLKLKGSGASSSPDVNANADSVAPSRKRKEPPSSSLVSSEAPSKQRKSVSFASNVLATSDSTPKRKTNKKTRKAMKKALKKKKLAVDTKEEATLPNMERSLEYLSLWQTSRETWRFNKNCQRLVLKYVFLGTDSIPSSHMAAFYDYIRDLKGGSRRRLREEAGAICSTDAAEAKEQLEGQEKATEGKEGKEDKKDKSEPIANVAEYVRVLDECVAARSDDSPTRIDETEFLPRLEEASLRKRLARRIRAENIVHELDSSSDDGKTGDSKADAVKLTAEMAQRGERKAVEEQKKPSDEPPEKKKKSVRSSKKRTMVDSDSDSSSDDSDSDTDSDSSSD